MLVISGFISCILNGTNKRAALKAAKLLDNSFENFNLNLVEHEPFHTAQIYYIMQLIFQIAY